MLDRDLFLIAVDLFQPLAGLDRKRIAVEQSFGGADGLVELSIGLL